jgi:hypothetical protein
MQESNNMSGATPEDLKRRYALGAVIDEGMADKMSGMAMRLREQGHSAKAQQCLEASRSHRVGAMKFRALMSALVVRHG